MAKPAARSQGAGGNDSEPRDAGERAGCTARPGTYPGAAGQQDTRRDGARRAASLRKQPRASMTTEYQERFLPPRCFKTVVSTSIQKDPYHPLKGRSNMTAMRSFYVTSKWMKDPPKPPHPPSTPKEHQRPGSAPGNPARVAVNRPASGGEDYTSVYKSDFRAWIANRRQPYRLNDSLRVNQGLVVINSSSKGGRVQKNSGQLDTTSGPAPAERAPRPFESITSYRSDYVTHEVQPRTRRVRPVDQTNGGPPLEEPAASFRPKLAWQTNQELLDGVNDLFQQFKSWSLETKVHCRAPGPPADHGAFLSTTHAAYTPHKCQRTAPILPSVRSGEKSKKPFLATSTMKEDYKAWGTLVTLPHRQKKQTPCQSAHLNLLRRTPKPASPLSAF